MIIDDKKAGAWVLAILLFVFLSCSAVYYAFFIHGRYEIAIAFPDLGILAIDDAVKIRGKNVGKVISITHENGQALVKAQMFEPVILYRDYRINERDKGLMGDREIEILPGYSNETADLTRILKGHHIPGISENMAMAARLKTAMAELHIYLRQMTEGTARKPSFPKQFWAWVEKLDALSADLDNLCVRLEMPVKNGVTGMQALAGEARKQSFLITGKAEVLLPEMELLLAKVDSSIALLTPALASLETVLVNVQKPTQLSGRLLQPYSKLDTLAVQITNLQKDLASMRKARLNINLF